MTDTIPLIEPYPVPDEFYCGLARVQDLGNCARFVLYTDDVRYEDGERPIHIVGRKIVLPLSACAPGVEMTARFLARKAVHVAGFRLLHLVKG